MKTELFNYNLPKELIANKPCEPRDACKLLVYDSSNDKVIHTQFREVKDFLADGDALVVNNSKVVPARLLFDVDGKEREIFVLKALEENKFRALVRPGKWFKVGKQLQVDGLDLTVIEVLEDGSRIFEWSGAYDGIYDFLNKMGTVPLPHYIENSDLPMADYQTVYADCEGSVAAPTAGLHFTDALLERIQAKGVSLQEVLLHVGRGTFLPVTAEDLREHEMHFEEFVLTEEVAGTLNAVKSRGRKVTAVGTTSVRVLESCASEEGVLEAKTGETDLYIYPGHYEWRFVDQLITNFHLPKSTLLMLVSSFLEHKGLKSGREKLLELYEIAKAENYQFYSLGDAMMII